MWAPLKKTRRTERTDKYKNNHKHTHSTRHTYTSRGNVTDVKYLFTVMPRKRYIAWQSNKGTWQRSKRGNRKNQSFYWSFITIDLSCYRLGNWKCMRKKRRNFIQWRTVGAVRGRENKRQRERGPGKKIIAFENYVCNPSTCAAYETTDFRCSVASLALLGFSPFPIYMQFISFSFVLVWSEWGKGGRRGQILIAYMLRWLRWCAVRYENISRARTLTTQLTNEKKKNVINENQYSGT